MKILLMAAAVDVACLKVPAAKTVRHSKWAGVFEYKVDHVDDPACFAGDS